MKRALFAAILLLTPFISDAQEPPPPAAPAATEAEAPKTDDTAKPDKPEPAMTGDETMELVDKDVETADALNEAVAIVDAAKDLKDADEEMDLKVLITALLAVIFKFLLSAIKLSGRFSDKLKEFWASDKGKLVLRLSTLVLGAAVMLVANIGAGVPWLEALFMGIGSGPGSLAIHESVKIIPMFAKKSEPAGGGNAEG